MKEQHLIICYYTKRNKYSFNPIIGSIDEDEELCDIPIEFADNPEDLFSKIAQNKKKRIFLMLSFATTQIFEITDIVHKIRTEIQPDKITIIAGGPHPSGDSDDTLKMGIDVCVRGEGELTIRNLLKCLINGNDLKTVKGITFAEKGSVFSTPKEKPIALDDYPAFGFKRRNIGAIEITRGCNWGCKFCQTTYLLGRKVRHRSIGKICEYAEKLIALDRKDIRFISPDAFSYGAENSKKQDLTVIETLLKELHRIISGRGRLFYGTFPSEVRPDSVNDDVLSMISKYCDGRTITLGAQSGSERVLLETRRNHSLEDVCNAVKSGIKFGFTVNVDFIFGLPGETQKDAKETFKFIEKLSKLGARIHGHTFIPLAGTPYYTHTAAPLEQDYVKYLKHLIATGKMFGQWEKQKVISRKISEYFNYFQT